MYWFWYFLMASQPYLILLGMLDMLGEDGKKAAEDISVVYAVVMAVVVVIFLVFALLKSIGVVS